MNNLDQKMEIYHEIMNALSMIPLESPVPEIGTLGSVSGDWKRDYGSRTVARRESVGVATGP